MTTIEIKPARPSARQVDGDSLHVRTSGYADSDHETISMSLVGNGADVRWAFWEWSPALIRLRRTEWFVPTIQAVIALPWTSDGWMIDGVRTQQVAVSQMLSLLTHALDSRVPPPTVVPTSEGGIQVEWHRNGIDLEIESPPSGQVEFFFSSQSEEYEGLAWEELDRLAEYARIVMEVS